MSEKFDVGATSRQENLRAVWDLVHQARLGAVDEVTPGRPDCDLAETAEEIREPGSDESMS